MVLTNINKYTLTYCRLRLFFACSKTNIMSLSIEAKAAQVSWIELLKEQVGSLRYGIVQIVVHDRRVVQIERTEKFRFDKPEKKGELSD
jgi:hypothetical protein